MNRYTFRSHRGNGKDGLVTVDAPDEITARRRAMEKHWGGGPVHDWTDAYEGKGLILISTEVAAHV